MRWYLRESTAVATSCGYPGDITSKGATSRNLNESKVPTSLLLKLVSQRERNRVFSSMLLDRVSDGFVVDTETRTPVDPLNTTCFYRQSYHPARLAYHHRCNFAFRFSARHEIYLPAHKYHPRAARMSDL